MRNEEEKIRRRLQPRNANSIINYTPNLQYNERSHAYLQAMQKAIPIPRGLERLNQNVLQ